MKFEDVFVDREKRFSIGIETQSDKYYLSFPVSNMLVEYEEYYELSKAEFELYVGNPAIAAQFLEEARNHEHDDRLILRPGRDRGAPG